MRGAKAAGDQAEGMTARCLMERGCALLARQWRCRFGELDLVVRDPAGILCFVEVKRRGPGARGLPREAVDARKQERLRKAAAAYLAAAEWDGPARFDVAEVYEAENGSLRMVYLENAFE